LNVRDATANLRRKAGSRPPLAFVLGWFAATIAIWFAINTEAGRLVWWW
jgi:hypothetical protein